MNIKLEVIDISPSLKKLKNEDEAIILSLTSPKGTSHIFNMSDIIESNVPIFLKIEDQNDLINYSIYKDEFLLGEGDFSLFNDIKWLNLNSIENNDNNNIENIKIKIKCQIEDYNNTIHNSKIISHKKNNKSSLVKDEKKNNFLEKNLRTLSPKENKIKNFKLNIDKKTIKQINKKRKNSSNKLKYNKSCEDGNLISQDFLDDESQSNPLYNSMIYNNKKEMNENNNNSKINKNIKKTKGKKGNINKLNNTEYKTTSSRNLNLINSTMRENNTKITKYSNYKNNKNEATINITDSSIIKKLNDKFKSVEGQILDLNFENNLNKEIEFTNKNLNENKSKFENDNNISNNNINNSHINCNIYNNDNENINISFNSYNINFDNNDNEELFIESEFENLKNDFEIFYTNDYLNNIQEDVLQLEIQLLFEKIFELQSVYHKEYNNLQKVFYYFKNIFQNIIEKYKMINKIKYKLITKVDSIQIENNCNVFVNNYKFQNNKETIDINKIEFNLWKIMITNNRKEILKYIFIKNILEKYNNIKNNLNNIEKEKCEKLIEKYKINILNNSKIKNKKKEVKNKGKKHQSLKELSNKNIETNPKKNNNNLNNCSNQLYLSFGNSLKSSFQQQQNSKVNSIKTFRKYPNFK